MICVIPALPNALCGRLKKIDMKKLDLLEIMFRLLYVPKCVACGERLPLTHPDGVLCEFCRGRYENEKEATCPVCAMRMSDCCCILPGLPKSRVQRMIKLVRYRPALEDASASVIYALKHRRLKNLHRFIGKEMAYPLSRMIEDPCEWMVTYPPRSRKSLRHDGFDHAAAAAREIAAQLGVAYLPTLKRVGGGAAQKKLSRTDRLAAAKENYRIRENAPVQGKRLILFDDICTTGATLTACARLLYRAGAREVVFAVIAHTVDKGKSL